MSAFLDPQNLMLVGIILCLLVISSFFFSSETALTAASRVRMHSAEKDGDRRAVIVQRLMTMRERLLGGILLGNNLVNIAASAVATVLGLRLYGDVGIEMATVVLTLVILIFSEVTPKTVAALYPEKVSFPASFFLLPMLKWRPSDRPTAQ